MPESISPTATHVKLQPFAALDARLLRDGADNRRLNSTQQSARAHRAHVETVGTVDLSEQLVGHATPVVAIARELLLVVFAERASVALDRLDAQAIANGGTG